MELGKDIPDLPAAVWLLENFGFRQGLHEMARDLLGLGELGIGHLRLLREMGRSFFRTCEAPIQALCA